MKDGVASRNCRPISHSLLRLFVLIFLALSLQCDNVALYASAFSRASSLDVSPVCRSQFQQSFQYSNAPCDRVRPESTLFAQKSTNPKKSDKSLDLLSFFLKSFWRGMSLPFPVLRNVVLPKALKGDKHCDSSSFTVGLSFREGLLALLLYLAIGVFAYSFALEKWSIVDSLYFTSVCFSTVGYGDLCPTNPASKMFTCVFGLGGIAFLGAAVAAVSGRVVEAEIQAVTTAKYETSKRLMHLFDGMPDVLVPFRQKPKEEQIALLSERAKQARHEQSERFQQVFRFSVSPSPNRVDNVLRNYVFKALPPLGIMFLGGLTMNRLNGNSWHIGNSFYYALVTASTIGFGDLYPQTRAARMFAIVFIPVSVAAAGELLSGVAVALINRRQRQVFEKQLSSQLTLEHLSAMDADNNGQITREEYVDFMLKEMGRVSQTDLDELFLQFERLDVTRSGYLDNEDLKLMAKIQGATVKV